MGQHGLIKTVNCYHPQIFVSALRVWLMV